MPSEKLEEVLLQARRVAQADFPSRPEQLDAIQDLRKALVKFDEDKKKRRNPMDFEGG